MCIVSSDSLTGGSIVGDIAPYQAFAIGGLGSVRGYGEGAVGSGRSCLVANSELILPLVCSNIAVSILFITKSYIKQLQIVYLSCVRFSKISSPHCFYLWVRDFF